MHNHSIKTIASCSIAHCCTLACVASRIISNRSLPSMKARKRPASSDAAHLPAMPRPPPTEYELFGTDSDAEPDDKDKVKKEDEDKDKVNKVKEDSDEKDKKDNKYDKAKDPLGVLKMSEDEKSTLYEEVKEELKRRGQFENEDSQVWWEDKVTVAYSDPAGLFADHVIASNPKYYLSAY